MIMSSETGKPNARQRKVEFYAVFKRCRISIISVILIVGAFIIVQQAQDILRFLAQPEAVLQLFLFEICILYWAICVWYGGRFLLYHDFETIRSKSKDEKRMLLKQYLKRSLASSEDKKFNSYWGERNVPRFLGSMCWFGLGIAMLLAVRGTKDAGGVYYWLCFINIFFAGIFYAFTWGRRNFLYRKGYSEKRIVSFYEFSTPLRWFIFIYSALSVIAWLYIIIHGLNIQIFLSQKFGTAPILLLGSILSMVLATIAVLFGELYQIPMVIIILSVAGIFSIFNDNHGVRKIQVLETQSKKETKDIKGEKFFTAKELYGSWLKRMDDNYGTKMAHPMFVIAASGGGISAAYWTASVLGTLQDQNKSFAEHTIIISPVSGGTLGSLVFANLVAHGKKYPDKNYVENSQLILSKDFLSPALGSLIFYDFPARFLPIPPNRWIRIPDRATVLEVAWERAFPQLAGQFSALLEKERYHTIPTLLINGTSVETGKKILTTHLDLTGDFKKWDCKNFTIYPYNDIDIRMSTAVMMSARFPYFSPAGTIDSNNHVVDGGYYDNSGITTALQFYEDIELEVKKDFERKKVIPIFIQINNDYIDFPDAKEPEECKNIFQSWFGKAFLGIRAPIATFFNTRFAHVTSASKRVQKKFQEDEVGYYLYTFSIPGDIKVPLSWFLSEASQKKLIDQLQGDETVKRNMEAIKDKLLPFVSQTQSLPRIE